MDLGKRKKEFDYVKQMAEFYKIWIKRNFLKDFDVKCDEMITTPRSILQKLDTSVLLQDHRERGEDTFHFYLTHFRPIWIDCTCEGYHAENFAMALWQKPKNDNDILFLAEKNCTVVSHELSHELLRQEKNKNYVELVHDIWTKHLFNDLPYEKYDENFEKTTNSPTFLTIDTSEFRK